MYGERFQFFNYLKVRELVTRTAKYFKKNFNLNSTKGNHAPFMTELFEEKQ